MARRKKIYEGKAKILYEGPEPGTLVQYFKDEGAAGPTATRRFSSTSDCATASCPSRRTRG